ncbi:MULTISPECIES: DUF6382 domain-containing protein [Faecalicatena]|nr:MULTISPECIES: DUF6382 domain-containing protein [Faecalicatena]MCI6467391.1 DUF6382 domain-containing protein [Faecalicatena sp.]MDY5621013.1 DUF6382 domain-containing protein [Lachnospiraceae bacterium]
MKMKTGYEKELNKVCLHIDLPQGYEEDYQIHMLTENNIPGLLDITGCGIDQKSRYSYVVTGMISMKTMFETAPIKKDDMILFVNRLMEVVKSLRRYMLSPDSLLLYPEFMFFGSGTWHFCYLPARKKPLCEAFHIITEYFVKKLDYEETEGILLAYEIHKATLQENYDLEKIMDEYREHEEKRRGEERNEMIEETGGIPDDHLFSLEEEEYVQTPDVETIREIGGHWKPWKKAADKLKKGRWGNWRDLILETDGQQDNDPL